MIASNTTNAPAEQPAMPDRKRWPNYGTIWRWHFYAGLFCIPFVMILSVTGTIFLFRPQIEAWEEREFDRLPGGQQAIAYADQVRSAQTQTGGWLAALEVASEPATPSGSVSATRVVVESKGKRLRSYVEPASGEVLRVIDDSERFIRWIRSIHGELLLGKRGSYLVELAASWTIVMVVTGIALWMPKGARIAGVFYPRLSRQGKVFWKDLHSVIGFWSSGLIVFLIATGLPWSTFWGDYFKSARRWTGTAVAKQSWEGGHEGHEIHQHSPNSPEKPEAKPQRKPAWRKSAVDPSTYDLQQIDVVADYAKTLNWLPPIEINPPEDGSAIWTIQSTTANRPFRQSLQYDAIENRVVEHETFADKHWVDQVVGQGIALHEGQRLIHLPYGWINQALALFATSALVILSVSGVKLWWRRRSPSNRRVDRLGLSPPAKRQQVSIPTVSAKRSALVLLFAIGLGIYLPLFGVSLIIVLILDQIAAKFMKPKLGLPS
ncbi:PepSY-associated TM helix domain-containing protein [Rhodopirellula sp. MGV]|uniref:PepSY-associated TM helix domain-containing protein n=1 Tax=Rhodopirellula sp. MGV TaxID=2023130 RepID=UPI000B973464|nr:PepSY domain-containing protein [Rhodopirellula sp. MGV]OYP38378.1 hypothetical protein CGZ80_02200 [Rhodopirellula sp. MGV]PNY34200.1 PepSY domain-containing protein [Rhodopirellula baltica]